ncbi:MAG TPA: 50S ribosomal protein L4 [Acidimicrobiales bacterium]|nr:50S ribosomal protein L4 [Acidimicrobiales bacterium]
MAAQLAERDELRTVTVERRTDGGEVLGTVELSPEIFGRTPNVPLMHQVVTAQLAARRSGTHSTKTRAEVRGGGSKPYRQKGTGRARQGTIRAPQFEGGGIALGPKPRSYRQHTPRKMTRLALYGALSDRAANARVCLVDRWSFDVPKTKDALRAIEALGLDGNILVVLGPDDEIAERSFANLPEVDLVDAAQLTAYDVLANDWIVFTDATLPGATTEGPESAPVGGTAEEPTGDGEPGAAATVASTEEASAELDETGAGEESGALAADGTEAAGVSGDGDGEEEAE